MLVPFQRSCPQAALLFALPALDNNLGANAVAIANNFDSVCGNVLSNQAGATTPGVVTSKQNVNSGSFNNQYLQLTSMEKTQHLRKYTVGDFGSSRYFHS